MSIKQKIDLARQELLDMGLRSNPLLNYRSNAKSLDVTDGSLPRLRNKPRVLMSGRCPL